MKTYNGRCVVQPIRKKSELENAIKYLKEQVHLAYTENGYFIARRNLMMFITGINTALRISDLLKLKVEDVVDGYVNIKEKKTGKNNQIYMSNELLRLIRRYIKRFALKKGDYLFRSQKGKNQPITTTQAYRVMRKLKAGTRLNYPIGTHTMRKTFGYHYYKKTKNMASLMKMLNHDNPSVTMVYIGMAQDEVDKERKSFALGI